MRAEHPDDLDPTVRAAEAVAAAVGDIARAAAPDLQPAWRAVWDAAVRAVVLARGWWAQRIIAPASRADLRAVLQLPRRVAWEMDNRSSPFDHPDAGRVVRGEMKPQPDEVLAEITANTNSSRAVYVRARDEGQARLIRALYLRDDAGGGWTISALRAARAALDAAEAEAARAAAG